MNTPETQSGGSLKPVGSATGIATRIVAEVLKELRGRKGFGHWWDSIDEETQNELLFTLMEKVEAIIPQNSMFGPRSHDQWAIPLVPKLSCAKS